MTTICYSEGVLASDSAAVTGGGTTYITYQKKIHLSACKRLAWGFSGQVIDPLYIPKLELLLIALVMDIRDKGGLVIPFSKELTDIVANRDFILMTHDSVYVKRSGSDENINHCARLLEGEVVAIGTGRIFATAALLHGKTPLEAVEFASEHDFFTYHSKVLQLKQSVLKPLPKEVK